MSPGSRRRTSRLGTLAVLSGVAMTATMVAPLAPPATIGATARSSVAGQATTLVRVGSPADALPGDRPDGALPPGKTLSLGVALAPRDPGGLADDAAAVSTPGTASFHHYLRPEQFAARFGPTKATIAGVEDVLRGDGLAVGEASANGLIVPFSGTAARVEHAFHTTLLRYQVAGATGGWAAAKAPLLPSTIAGSVAGILGLANLATPRSLVEPAPAAARRAVAKRSASRAGTGTSASIERAAPAARAHPTVSTTHRATAAPVACRAAILAAEQGGGWTDQQIATAYGLAGLYDQGDVGAGQTIALYELEPFGPSDVATFDRCYFGASHTGQITTIPVDGFSEKGLASGEAVLDVETLSALAPAARILVYEGPNTTFGGIDAFNAIIGQDRASIVSTSWGECEAALEVGAPEALQIENTLFEEAASQGQTVLAASGDAGSDDCASTPFSSTKPVAPYLSVDDPSSQPYVVGVGGTSLLSATDPPAQTVWNDGAQWGGSGGGMSSAWPSPPWQAGSGVPGVDPAAGRQVPDVSASADEWRGVTVFSIGFAPSGGDGPSSGNQAAVAGWATIGGTSSAAPTWAAIVADVAASTPCASLPAADGSSHDLGFVGPELYQVGADPTTYASSFSQVTKGDNDVFGLGLGYRAGAGYNMATGLGTPLVTGATGGGGLNVSLCRVAAEPATAEGPAAGRPVVTSLSPSSGPTSGGTTVTITGSGFPTGEPSAVKVAFGPTPATVVSVPSPTTLVVQTDAAVLAGDAASFERAGPVQAMVTVAGATSRAGPDSTFDETAPTGPSSGSSPPTVAGIGPSGVNVAGGATVTVYGSGFAAADPPTVSFGGVAGSDVQVVGTSRLTVVVPPKSPATRCETGTGFAPTSSCQVEVVVSDHAGTSPMAPILPTVTGSIVLAADGVVKPPPGTEVAPAATELDYAPTPHITSVAPDPDDASETIPVVITGSGFNFNTLDWVNFGPASSARSVQIDIAVLTPTEIVIQPPLAPSPMSDGPQPPQGGISVQSAGGLSNVYPFSYTGAP